MPRPTKAALNKVLRNMRMYLSCRADTRGRPSDEARLKARTERACAKVANQIGADPAQVWAEVAREARRVGPLTPILGKDI